MSHSNSLMPPAAATHPLTALSRSRVAHDHAILTPESHVVCPMPGWTDASGVTLIAPPMGAGFCQYLITMDSEGRSGAPQPGVSRFVFVLDGTLTVETDGSTEDLSESGFGYFPPDHEHQLVAKEVTRLLVFEKRFVSLGEDADSELKVVLGREQDVPSEPFFGDPDAQLRTLLPTDLPYDMAVNTFEFAPGGTLPMVEVHVMEHGLTFLGGQGVYRLGDSWYPVQRGDTIWMAPYLPQWFVAIGKEKARYIYYKDQNRDPLADEG